MKIKGVIEDLKIVKSLKKEKEKKKKNGHKNSKDISRTFSGVFVGSVESVYFQIVPWSSLYFSRSIGPSHSATEKVSLKKCPPPPSCVRAEIRH